MTRAIQAPAAACLLVFVGLAFPGSASLAADAPGARLVPVQYTGAPTTGSHHRRNHAGGEASKSVDPSHADLHGATRESADKAYRKQYGF